MQFFSLWTKISQTLACSHCSLVDFSLLETSLWRAEQMEADFQAYSATRESTHLAGPGFPQLPPRTAVTSDKSVENERRSADPQDPLRLTCPCQSETQHFLRWKRTGPVSVLPFFLRGSAVPLYFLMVSQQRETRRMKCSCLGREKEYGRQCSLQHSQGVGCHSPKCVIASLIAGLPFSNFASPGFQHASPAPSLPSLLANSLHKFNEQSQALYSEHFMLEN